jgi:hypothetical protein
MSDDLQKRAEEWADAWHSQHGPGATYRDLEGAYIAGARAERERLEITPWNKIGMHLSQENARLRDEIKKLWESCRLSDENNDKAITEIERLRAELNEQARLNGMGSEREARLMAENERLLRDAWELRQNVGMLTETVGSLRAALEWIANGVHPLNRPDPIGIARKALGHE